MFGNLFVSLAHLIEVYRSRRVLAKLSHESLRDIGISRRDADMEAGRAPWDSNGFPIRRTPDGRVARPHLSRR